MLDRQTTFRHRTGVSLVFMLLAFAGVSAPVPPPVVRPGWDWSLPPDVEPAPYSGYITWGPKRYSPAITVRGIMVTWKRLNPKPGVYDWDWLEDRIARAQAAGMRVGIHLKGVQREAVPDWVIERFHPVVVDVPPLQAKGQPWRIQNVLPWQPDVDRAFHKFLEAFGKTGIPQRESIVYGYIHGISASRGEEMFIRKIDLAQWQETTGLTPEVFADWLKRRIDALCTAFKGVEFKLALMFGGPLGPTPEFRKATAGIVDYALSKGVGVRGGAIDFMHALYVAPAWASRLEDGYCLVDDNDPVIRERRFRGDENEEYGRYWTWRFGPVEGYPYRHRICVLRGLQMRQNFQMVSPATLALNPALNEYARIVQGYRRDDSPDAWAYLRETYIWRGPVRNIERWLIQRERPGSQTVPDERVDRSPLPGEKSGQQHDFDARRTNIAAGQTGILFRLDPVFWPTPAPAMLKVTFIDRAPARWWVRYTKADGQNTNTPAVQNMGDGERKTATFTIPELNAAGRFPDDAGFRAWLKGLPSPAELVDATVFDQQGRDNPAQRLYRLVPDPERPGKRIVLFAYKRFDDTLHADQLLQLHKGVCYRVRGSIRNDGNGLKPAIRVAGMDWKTVVYLEATKRGEWQALEQTFVSRVDGPVRLQLFGQGRANHAPGISGTSRFRDISLRPLGAEEIQHDYAMDFRIETAGPGDITVTLVRVVKSKR